MNGLLSQIAQGGSGQNFGTGYLQGLQLKGQMQGQDLQNRLGQMKLDQYAQEQQQMGSLRDLRQRALGGDQEALMGVGAIDPAEMSVIQQNIGRMDDQQRQAAQERIEDMARAADWVLSQPQENQSRAYEVARQTLLQENPDMQLPEQYDPQQVDLFRQQIKPISEMFKTQQPTSLQKNLEAAGYEPGTDEFRDVMRSSITKPETQVNVNQDIRTAEEEARVGDVKSRAERARSRISGIYSTASDAAQRLPNIDRALSLLDKVDTGPFEEMKLTTVRGINSLLGTEINADQVSSAEQLRTLLGDEVMARVAQTKGAVSEREMDLFTTYSANFGNTTEGNRRILQFLKGQLERSKKLAGKVEEWEDKDLSSIEIERNVRKYMDENPISDVLEAPAKDDLTPEEKAELEALRKELGR